MEHKICNPVYNASAFFLRKLFSFFKHFHDTLLGYSYELRGRIQKKKIFFKRYELGILKFVVKI